MNAKDEVFETIKNGDADRLRALLAEDPSLASARDRAGVSALLHARYRGRQEILDLLLACHPRLEVFEAAALGQTRVVEERLDEEPSGATAFSGDGFTALHLAAYFAHPETVEVLIERGADPRAVAKNASMVTPLHSAAAGRSVDVVRLLLRCEVDVNARQQGGWTALHQAALLGDAGMARLLLGHGASVQAVSDDAKTPLDLALEKGHTETVGILRAGR